MPAYPSMVAPTFLAIILVIYLFALLISIAAYVINGISILKLCKKLNIENGFLGFIPVANVYKLGQIADRASLIQGQKKKYAKTLLTLSIIVFALSLLLFVGAFGLGITAGVMEGGGYVDPSFGYGFSGILAIVIIGIIVLYLGILGVAITLIVFTYIALYKIFKLFKPESAVGFLIASILVSGIHPIFLLICALDKKPIPYQAPFNTYANVQNPNFAVQQPNYEAQPIAEAQPIVEAAPISEAPHDTDNVQ